MNIIVAIIQSILQSVLFLFPFSESGMSSLFRQFSHKGDSSFTMLTGVIFVGISIGIIISMFKWFYILCKESVLGTVDLIKTKQFKTNSYKSYIIDMLISYVPFLIFLLPIKGDILFNYLARTQNNSSIVDDGCLIIVFGLLLFAYSYIVQKDFSIELFKKNTVIIRIIKSLLIGVLCVVSFSLSGLSCVFILLLAFCLFGENKKQCIRNTFTYLMPIVLARGIYIIAVSSLKATAIQIVVSLVISIAITFICVRVLNILLKSDILKMSSIFNISFGIFTLFSSIFI